MAMIIVENNVIENLQYCLIAQKLKIRLEFTLKESPPT